MRICDSCHEEYEELKEITSQGEHFCEDCFDEWETHNAISDMDFETIRAELEKHYTHATLVGSRDANAGGLRAFSLWCVGEEGEALYVWEGDSVDTAVVKHEGDMAHSELKQSSAKTRAKLSYFRQAMELGLIRKDDRKLYKKYTLNQLREMVLNVISE